MSVKTGTRRTIALLPDTRLFHRDDATDVFGVGTAGAMNHRPLDWRYTPLSRPAPRDPEETGCLPPTPTMPRPPPPLPPPPSPCPADGLALYAALRMVDDAAVLR